MFDFIKKYMFGTSNVPVVDSESVPELALEPIPTPVQEPVRQPTLFECENILVNKYFTNEQIRELPSSYSIDPLRSDIIIESNGKKFNVGCYEYRYLLNEREVVINICEVKIVSNNRKVVVEYLSNVEKCKFILNNLEQVESSLQDIAHKCDIAIKEREQLKACSDKCASELFKKLS